MLLAHTQPGICHNPQFFFRESSYYCLSFLACYDIRGYSSSVLQLYTSWVSVGPILKFIEVTLDEGLPFIFSNS